MNRTKIEYLDYTWNPLVGCHGITCAVRKECWARKQAKRRKHACSDCYDFKPHYHLERKDQPLHLTKPSKIGFGFMADPFDSGFGICSNQSLFDVMQKASWHRFLCLTKQSENMKVFARDWQVIPDNVCMGVSVNRVTDLHRIDDLREINAKVKCVSAEPLLEDLARSIDLSGINWLIVGAQTRPNLQPDEKWVHDLINKAGFMGIPVFLKNNLSDYHWYHCRLFPESWYPDKMKTVVKRA
jgi:protein gp37